MRTKALPYFLALAALAGCTPEAPVFEPVPEPASALRAKADRGAVPEDARVADYVLEARLDADKHQVTGSARVTWRNTTSRTVDTLPFHLYMNAFRAEDTAWMQTSRGFHRDSKIGEDEGVWGYIDVHSVELLADDSGAEPRFVEDAVERAGGGEPVPLPFREDEDPSTMTVELPRPVGPGESVTVALDFTTQLPEVVARTGFKDDFHAVAQWYPKLGVLEEGGWQAHDFTVNDEFYADFGNYRAAIEVPEGTVVGATGILAGDETAGGRRRLTYEAEMVHDFVWMSDPDFVDQTIEHDGIRIRQLIQPEYASTGEEHLEAVSAALDSYQKRYGPYPWSTVTIVHPPRGAAGAGGMEYPTLFTSDDRKTAPEWAREPAFEERVSGLFTTVHEFGHQYFQGLFASREHLEPWLDEGINSFSNVLAYQDWLGSDDPWMADLLSQRFTYRDASRLMLRFRAFLQPVALPARDFEARIGSYGPTVYTRAASLMLTLRNLAGEDDFDRAFRVYCDRVRFRHPTGDKLVATLVEELGGRVVLQPPGVPPPGIPPPGVPPPGVPPPGASAETPAVELDVAEYLEQALDTTRQIDFAIVSVRNRRLGGAAGWHRDAGGELVGGEAPADLETDLEELPDAAVEGAAIVSREGDFVVPVEILARFADGSEERWIWDARERVAVFRWPGRRLHLVRLDPDELLHLEYDRRDNNAYASDAGEADGLSKPAGDLAEAFHLAVWGALGP
jgi:hypothetical protein